MKAKAQKLRKVLKFAVVVICLTGFLLQTHEFLELYWTYPTVVDIQVSVPSEIDLPAISFCSTNGLKPSVICEQPKFCMQSEKFEAAQVCAAWPEICDGNSTMNRTFDIVSYSKYSKHSDFNASFLERLRKPVKDFLTCKIKSAGQTRQCDLPANTTKLIQFSYLDLQINMSSMIIGPYYSDTNLFNFCYTMNGQWSNPNYKPPRIKKSERIEMEFFIDISDTEERAASDEVFPKFNYPSYPGVQLAIHSPFLSLSPYVIGSGFLAGKSYQIKLEQEEKHLLPSPYQTNCTDYLNLWKARGGIGPLNQMMVVEECIYNTSLLQRGCVSFSIDYPHNKTVCKYCEDCDDLNEIREECTKQLSDYNQPCDFITYTMQIDEKLVDIKKKFTSFHLRINETVVQKRKGYDCSDQKIWTKLCQTVTVELVFDNYQITNLTYNPKFESIELFSVIGGYMGMYLGVSIVAVYDFAEFILIKAYQVLKQRRVRKKKERIEKRKNIRMQKEKFENLSGYRNTFNRMY